MIQRQLTLALATTALVLALHSRADAASPPRAVLTAQVIDTDSTGTITCGDLVDYSLSISPFPDPADDVEFELLIDSNLTYLPNSLQASSTQGAVIVENGPTRIHIRFGDLGFASATWRGGIAGPGSGSVIVAQGNVTGSNFSPTLTDSDDSPQLNPTLVHYHPCPASPSADLSLTKTDGGITATPGSTVVYTLTALNLGPAAAIDAVLQETVPTGSTFNAAASSPGWTCSGASCQLPLGTLAFAGTATRLFAVTVPVSTTATSLSNTATTSSSRPDPETSNNTATDTTPIDLGQPDLRLTKTVSSGSPDPGGTLVYTLTLTNAGNRAASSPVLSETVPASTSFAPGASSPGWTCSPSGNAGSTCTLNVADLAPGGSASRTFAVTLANPLPPAATSIVNTACSSTSTPGDPPADNCSTITTPTTGSPSLTISKTDGGISASPGDTIVYTIAYSNLGPGNAPATSLTETVPAHTTFAAASSSPGWTCSPNGNAGSSCSLLHGALVSGGSSSKLFAVTVGSVPAGVTSTSNTVSITSSAPDSDPSDNTATDTTPLDQGTPDLSLTKTLSSGTGDPGATLIYQITVTNSGNGPAASLTLTETVPQNTFFAPAESSPGWACSPDSTAGSTCSVNTGTLAAGATLTRAFAVTIVTPLPANVTSIGNTACLSTPTPGDPASDNCDTVTTPATGSPSLNLAKSLDSGSATPGSTLVFRLTVTNSGNQGAANVALSETVPAHTAFSPAQSSPGWTCSPGPLAGSTCSLSVGTIAGAGGSANRLIAFVVDNPLPAGVDRISNSACASSANLSSCDDIDVPTTASPNLSVSKALAGGSAVPGSVLTYAITIQNTGNQAAAAVSLTETVPLHTTFEAGQSSSGWTCSPGNGPGSTCSLAVGPVAGGGATASRSFAVRIADPLPAGVTSVANEACASIPPSGVPSCDSVTVPLTASPVLEILKTLKSAAISPGTPVLYGLMLHNSGNQDASGVTVTDQVPAFTTFDPTASSPGWSCTPDISSGSACSLSIGSLAAGESREVLFAADLVSPLPAEAVSLTNLGCLTDDTGISVCSSTTGPISAAPVLVLTKVAPASPLAPGQTVSFSLHLTNTGNRVASGVVITETVPEYSAFSSAASSPGWTCLAASAGSICTYPVGSLAPGQAASATFTVIAANPLPEGTVQLANAACAEDASGTKACDDASTPLPTFVEAQLIDALHTDADGDGFPDPGEVLAYTLLVTNPSSSALADLVITAALDPHLSLVPGSVETSLGTVLDSQAPAVSLASLAPQAAVTITFLAEVALELPPGLDRLSSQASVAGSNFATEPSDDPDTLADDDPTETPLSLEASPIADIPTLSEVGALLLIAITGAVALMRLRST